MVNIQTILQEALDSNASDIFFNRRALLRLQN